MCRLYDDDDNDDDDDDAVGSVTVARCDGNTWNYKTLFF